MKGRAIQCMGRRCIKVVSDSKQGKPFNLFTDSIQGKTMECRGERFNEGENGSMKGRAVQCRRERLNEENEKNDSMQERAIKYRGEYMYGRAIQ